MFRFFTVGLLTAILAALLQILHAIQTICTGLGGGCH